ncbi:hypothetical protein GEMRC1_008954 [Eukaryota sp. GEM-RC1]
MSEEFSEEYIYEGGRLMPGGSRAPPGGAYYNPETGEIRPIRSEKEIEELRKRSKKPSQAGQHKHEQPQEKTTHKRRYGPGQLIKQGVRAGPNGAELDIDTGEIFQYSPDEEVRHLGPGQFVPGGERCGPGGCDVDKKTGKVIWEPERRSEYLEEEKEAKELDELERRGL